VFRLPAHSFRDPAEGFLHKGDWYLTMGSTSTPGGPVRDNPASPLTAAARLFRARSEQLQAFQEVGFLVQTNTSLGGSNNVSTGAWDEDLPANALVTECPRCDELSSLLCPARPPAWALGVSDATSS
jgi:hypothetical protein